MKINLRDISPEDSSYDNTPLPPGWYQMVIQRAMIETGKKAETGRMLSLELRADHTKHPDCTDVLVFQRLCFEHAKPKPKAIALRQMSQLVHSLPAYAATLELDLDAVGDLVGQVLMVRLKIEPGDGQYGPRNAVTGFAAIGAQLPEDPRAEARATTAPRPNVPPPQSPPSGMTAGTTPKRPAWGR